MRQNNVVHLDEVRLRKLLATCRCQLVMLDEAQREIPESTAKSAIDIEDVMKALKESVTTDCALCVTVAKRELQ
jgi:hypothetical protein